MGNPSLEVEHPDESNNDRPTTTTIRRLASNGSRRRLVVPVVEAAQQRKQQRSGEAPSHKWLCGFQHHQPDANSNPQHQPDADDKPNLHNRQQQQQEYCWYSPTSRNSRTTNTHIRKTWGRFLRLSTAVAAAWILWVHHSSSVQSLQRQTAGRPPPPTTTTIIRMAMAFSWPTTVRTTVRRCATPPTTVSFCSRVAPPLRIHGRAYFNNDNNSNRGTTTTTTTTLLMSTTNTNNNNSNKPPGIPSYRRRRRLQRQRSDNIGGDSFDPSLVGETTLDGSTSTKEYYARPVVQWYPGHIAKAERALAETIRAVDVVIEVRDARVPLATRHSMVAAWCQNTPRIVVCTRADAISNAALTAWRTALEHLEIPISTTTTVSPPLENNSKSEVVAVRFLDAQTGTGVHGLIRAVTLAGAPVHARRTSRGLLARPLRVGILGYPNVGKSTLINRIIGGKKRCRTANIPGVTRSLQWIRVRSDSTTTTSTQRGREFEVLDSPGIIPASLTDQSDAMLVAACNCIGEKAYDNQAVATHLCATLLALHRQAPSHIIAMSAPQWRQKCIDRYRFDPLQPPESLRLNDNVKVDETAVLTPKSAAAAAVARGNAFTGDDFLFAVADATCQGNPEDAARKILQDFRTGRMGPICLQIPPQQQQQHSGMPTNSPTAKATVERSTARSTRADETNGMTLPRSDAREEKQRSAEQALATAKARGLVLPNSNNNNNNNDVEGDGTGEQTVDVTNGGGGSSTTTIGKGLFDGW